MFPPKQKNAFASSSKPSASAAAAASTSTSSSKTAIKNLEEVKVDNDKASKVSFKDMGQAELIPRSKNSTTKDVK